MASARNRKNRKNRKQFVEHLLTLGPILGIVLAFIGNPVERNLLAQDLTLFIISALSVYALLILELPTTSSSGRVLYSFGSLGLAAGFGFLIRLVVSFYGTVELQNAIATAVFLLVSLVMILPFGSPRSSERVGEIPNGKIVT
jgi:hypothetical protein